jgi:phosphoribosylanthranilate isomerase
MVRIKICGLTDPAGRDAAREGGADWLGLVFFSRSPRGVTPAAAAALAAGVPASWVGLFVRPSDAEVAAVLAEVRLSVLQVYADAARCAALRARFGLPVWRAIGVRGAEDLPTGADGVDGLVIEAPPPEGSDRPGGNAARFDWRMLAGWRAPLPWLLAGGLTAENVAGAIAATGAPGVDVSSGVESAPGRKDPARIAAFLAAARGGAASGVH